MIKDLNKIVKFGWSSQKLFINVKLSQTFEKNREIMFKIKFVKDNENV